MRKIDFCRAAEDAGWLTPRYRPTQKLLVLVASAINPVGDSLHALKKKRQHFLRRLLSCDIPKGHAGMDMYHSSGTLLFLILHGHNGNAVKHVADWLSSQRTSRQYSFSVQCLAWAAVQSQLLVLMSLHL